jgi:dihydrofolate reductase
VINIHEQLQNISVKIEGAGSFLLCLLLNLKYAIMRKVIMFNRISTDGFFAGPNGETHEWFIQDPALDKATHKMMEPDTVLLGRVTYQLFESYWPKVRTDPQAPKEARKIANELHDMKKLVVSHTLDEVSWENTRVIKNNLIEEVKKLKQGDGPDIVIFGSGTVVQQLTVEELIDEYLIAVTPIILGVGKSFFKDVQKLNLILLKAKIFDSGNVLLHYGIARKENSMATSQSGREKQLA